MVAGTLQPGETVKFTDEGAIVFGQDTMESLKEKLRQEKAAKKKHPKNFKPQNH
jgi:hypothetical protein